MSEFADRIAVDRLRRFAVGDEAALCDPPSPRLVRMALAEHDALREAIAPLAALHRAALALLDAQREAPAPDHVTLDVCQDAILRVGDVRRLLAVLDGEATAPRPDALREACRQAFATLDDLCGELATRGEGTWEDALCERLGTVRDALDRALTTTEEK
jgi:hypothetical protein